MRRIEGLARQFLAMRFSGALELWQFQRKLLSAQQAIQEAISEAKRAPRRERDLQMLEQLRWVRWQARLLGDTFAWVVLGLDDQTIVPLGENDRGSVPQRHSAGTLGVLAISESLANQGLGFPLIHDITDCLRIGDVTFVHTTGNRHERELTTFEVKTRQTGLEKDPTTGEQIASLAITVHGISASKRFAEVNENIPVAPLEEQLPTPRVDRRLEDQSVRMARALSKQTRPNNELSDLDGEPYLSFELSSESSRHWDALRYVTRTARRSGVGVRAIDQSFVYLAVYDDTNDLLHRLQSVDFKTVVAPEFRRVLPESERDARDSLVINAVLPPHEIRRPYRSMPYFLHPLAKTTIFDLMNRRMVVVVIVNPGPIIRRLEQLGFQVIAEPRRKLMPHFKVSCVIGEGDDRYTLHMDSFDHDLWEALHNFQGSEGVIAKIVAKREALRPLAGDIVAAHRAARARNVTVT